MSFDVDPWTVARKHYERRMVEFMASVMRQLGVTQIELPYTALVHSHEVVEMVDLPEKRARFYRIVGELHTLDGDGSTAASDAASNSEVKK